MASAAVIGGVTAGASAIGAVAGASAKESAIDLKASTAQLNIQSQATQESEQLNRSVSHNMVSASASGVDLGSGSILAMTDNDFHNYGEDKETYNMDSQMASLNADSQKSQVQMQMVGSLVTAGVSGVSIYSQGGAGSTPSTISGVPYNPQSGGFTPQEGLVSSQNAFEYTNSSYNQYGGGGV